MKTYIIHYRLAGSENRQADYEKLSRAIETDLPGCLHLPQSTWIGKSSRTLPELKFAISIAVDLAPDDTLAIFELTGKSIVAGHPAEVINWCRTNLTLLE